MTQDSTVYSNEVNNSINGVTHEAFQLAVDHWANCPINVGPHQAEQCPSCMEIDVMQAALRKFSEGLI